MELRSNILIERSPERIWAFLGDPANVAKWDLGVAEVEEKVFLPRGVGYEFDTIAHDWLNLPDKGRMSYRISEVNEDAGRCVVELKSRTGNARFFKTAAWQFEVRPSTEGALLTCSAIFALRLRYIFLAPLFYFKRNAILMDLTLLKHVIESEPN
jgi:Polyketide cyclase / dehydrase and lipid transport